MLKARTRYQYVSFGIALVSMNDAEDARGASTVPISTHVALVSSVATRSILNPSSSAAESNMVRFTSLVDPTLAITLFGISGGDMVMLMESLNSESPTQL